MTSNSHPFALSLSKGFDSKENINKDALNKPRQNANSAF